MAVEVQKLIAVSLGKIATSRSQRGGPSLHKSLLVSSVLYKARTTYNFHAFMAKRAECEEEQDSDNEDSENTGECEEPVIVRPGTPNPSCNPSQVSEEPAGNVPETPTKRARTENTCDEQEDKENSPPAKKQDCLQESSKVNLSESLNNNLPVVKSEGNDSVSKDCAKCLKRRMTDAKEPSECSSSKRVKSDSETCDSSDKVESMQTDNQITSLVQRFNSGLSNFLGSKNTNNSDCLNGQGQGHTESIKTLSKCSTQMKKDNVKFTDNLGSRPVIALSV
jgi:hypothetical protein